MGFGILYCRSPFLKEEKVLDNEKLNSLRFKTSETNKETKHIVLNKDSSLATYFVHDLITTYDQIFYGAFPMIQDIKLGEGTK